jgi:cardiolipin synthase A/B
MARYVEGNRIVLLHSGTEYFPALEAEIGRAREEIQLESYIYNGDGTGRRVTEALCAAARRGVEVRVLVDGFGSRDMPLELREQLRSAGARLLVYRPEISRFRFRRHRLRRMHRKLVVIDARVAFIGGINIIDDVAGADRIPPRYDYAVRVEGPLLAAIQREAERLWGQVSWARLRARWRPKRRAPVQAGVAGQQRAALLVRDNIRHRLEIEDAYLEAIDAARDEVIIANAYFFPGIRFRHALIRAAERGVRVVLLLQGRVEYVLLHYASRALYGTLLDAGVEIHEYHRSFLHAKVAVIDGHWATVGSSNIDPFSLMLAREANVAVEDAAFAAELRSSLHQALEGGAKVIVKTIWQHKPLARRVSIWLAYGIARFLMGMVGYGGQH